MKDETGRLGKQAVFTGSVRAGPAPGLSPLKEQMALRQGLPHASSGLEQSQSVGNSERRRGHAQRDRSTGHSSASDVWFEVVELVKLPLRE